MQTAPSGRRTWKANRTASARATPTHSQRWKPCVKPKRKLTTGTTYADGLSEAAHDQVVHFRFVDGGAGAMTRGDMLLHVVNHKTYHRGYVADMFCQASSRPPAMDLPVFLRDVPSAF
jgi:hypothetical protein